MVSSEACPDCGGWDHPCPGDDSAEATLAAIRAAINLPEGADLVEAVTGLVADYRRATEENEAETQQLRARLQVLEALFQSCRGQCLRPLQATTEGGAV